ncbi:MAG: DNA/RNA non-specific endonuclease [Spirochaetes bacterium]|nr:DNA/RNA non-specific endonuclease [Spirochaetota bacterium]
MAAAHRYPEIHCRHFIYGYPAGAPASNDLIIRDGYALSSNDGTKLADWVAYRVVPVKTGGGGQRRWRADPWLEEDETLEPEDYRGANSRLNLDRGHMAPYGSMRGTVNRRESNYLSNIMPQYSALNRGLWKQMEERERELAVSGGTVYVMAGPLFERPMPQLPGADEPHRIPSGFWKIVAVRNPGGVRVAGFIFDQRGNARSLLAHLCTVDEIERRSGLDFFWLLPPVRERRIERSIPRSWAARHFGRGSSRHRRSR